MFKGLRRTPDERRLAKLHAEAKTAQDEFEALMARSNQVGERLRILQDESLAIMDQQQVLQEQLTPTLEAIQQQQYDIADSPDPERYAQLLQQERKVRQPLDELDRRLAECDKRIRPVHEESMKLLERGKFLAENAGDAVRRLEQAGGSLERPLFGEGTSIPD